MPDADFHLVVDAGDQGRGIDARSQLPALQQLIVNRDVRIFRIHVLHAGDAERSGVRQGAFHRLHPLIVRERRRDLVDIVHGGVFERAGGIALCVANDDTAGRIWSFGGYACQAQRGRVRQSHVAVVAHHKYGSVGSKRVDQFLGGHPRGSPLGLVPVSAGDPLTLRRTPGALPNAPRKFLGTGGVVELYLVERQSAVDKMHVGVVKARQ